MAVYDRPQFLDLALQSLAAQTFQDWELLISDDASPHSEVREICLRYASKDPRIRYVRQPRNIGAMNNYLYVFGNTQAPLYLWADEDDLWEPTFIERGVAALDADRSKDAWFCQVDRIDARGNVYETLPSFTRFASTPEKRRDVIRFFMEPERLGRHYLFYCLFRREALSDSIDVLRKFAAVHGWDHLFVYSFICRHDIAISGETLFHKRWSGRAVKERVRNLNLINNRHFKG
jgi:glycosyltransferase involved in cell wall biosynthesis